MLRIDKDDVLAAKTARIVPTRFSEAAAQVKFTDPQRKLIGNAVARSVSV